MKDTFTDESNNKVTLFRDEDENEAISMYPRYIEYFKNVCCNVIRLENASFQSMHVTEKQDGSKIFGMYYSLECYDGDEEHIKYIADTYDDSHWLEFASVHFVGSESADGKWNIEAFSVEID